MAAITWDDITTTWDTEVRTWNELVNYVVTDEATFVLLLQLTDLISPKTWTPQPAIANTWTPQTEL